MNEIKCKYNAQNKDQDRIQKNVNYVSVLNLFIAVLQKQPGLINQKRSLFLQGNINPGPDTRKYEQKNL